jgi:hypothetical protein
MHIKPWMLFAGLLLGLVALRQNAIRKELIKPTSHPELTDSLILTLIYRKVEKSKEGYGMRSHNKFFSTVYSDSTQFSATQWKALDAVQIEYYVEHIEEIIEDSIPKFLVVLGGAGSSCHACPGVCAGAVFVRDGSSWKLETYENDIAVLGETGFPVNEVSVTEVNQGYGIILKNGGIWQGYNWRYFTVVLYEKGVFKEALAEPVYFSSDNWSNAENDYFTQAYSYTSFIYFVPGNHEFEDMVVYFQGTIFDKTLQKTVLLDRKVRFEYKNGLFKTPEKLPEEEE